MSLFNISLGILGWYMLSRFYAWLGFMSEYRKQFEELDKKD
jgi:hypothetical protein